DHVDLPVHDTRERVISGRRHRAAIGPRIGRGVVHLISAEYARGTIAEERRLTGVLHDRGAANHVELSANLLGNCRTAFDRHWRQRAPGVSARVVLPRIVDRLPATHAWT